MRSSLQLASSKAISSVNRGYNKGAVSEEDNKLRRGSLGLTLTVNQNSLVWVESKVQLEQFLLQEEAEQDGGEAGEADPPVGD